MEALISDPFYSILFVGTGLIFLLLELFLPSGGILGLLSLGCAAFGVFGLFKQGNIALALAAIVGSTAAAIAGIRFALKRLRFSVALSPETSNTIDGRIQNLLGKEGVAHTPLRPAGVVIIDGKKVDVVASGEFIEQNTRVRVVDNSGNRVVVRAAPPRPPETADARRSSG